MERMKIQKTLEDYQSSLKTEDNEEAFYLAICFVQLENFPEAQYQFERSINGMFNLPKLWKMTSQPNWLTDVCVLSGRTDLFPEVLKELELYKRLDKGYSLVALYSYGLMELLLPSGWDVSISIRGLIKRPKIKDMYAIGEILKSILNNDQLSFNEGLQRLLKAHEGIAKYGGLRESAEGFLCMPAMSLAYAAIRRNLMIDIENDYLSLDYLKFLYYPGC